MAKPVTTRVVGGRALRRRLDGFSDEAVKLLEDAVKRSALEVKGEASRNIARGARSGRIYPPIEGRRGKPHQASAPGEFPKRDSERLEGSIDWRPEAGIAASVFSKLNYAAWLEFGTRKMAARPWLRPTFEQQKPRIRKRLEAALKKATASAGRK